MSHPEPTPKRRHTLTVARWAGLALGFALSLLAVTACGNVPGLPHMASSVPTTPGPTSPDSSPTTPTAPDTGPVVTPTTPSSPVSSHGATTTPDVPDVTISGYAESADGERLTNVAIAFQRLGCPGCQIYKGTTGTTGSYELVMPAGTYLSACKPSGLSASCTAEGGSADVTLDGPTNEVDFQVAITIHGGDSSGGGDQSSANADAPVLSGHVTDTTGRPVAGVAIGVLLVGGTQNVHTLTDASGYYEIDRIPVPGTVVCEAASADSQCDPQGLTPPVTVSDQDPPTTINWVVSG